MEVRESVRIESGGGQGDLIEKVRVEQGLKEVKELTRWQILKGKCSQQREQSRGSQQRLEQRC